MGPSPFSDVVVVGAGAAGLMCAIEAAKRGRRVALLEHANEIGKKILISGGRRCNFTNIRTRPENYLSANPHFAKSALSRYSPADLIALVEKHRIPYHEKKLGQLFCDRSARDITRMLLAECRAEIILNCRIREFRRTTSFVLETSRGTFESPALVIATGGLSIPKIGATGFGYDIARQFGLKIVSCRPALVPLTLNSGDRDRWCDLAGVSAEVVATAGGQSFREKMLITHRGLSGPAILQASSYWQSGASLDIDLLPDGGAEDEPLRRKLPKRLADRWTELGGDPRRWRVTPSGTEGYEKAEVTAGGVDTRELDSKTMAARKVPGLYFIGEVVDVTGWLGGYNFQWAWASGYVAGNAI